MQVAWITYPTIPLHFHHHHHHRHAKWQRLCRPGSAKLFSFGANFSHFYSNFSHLTLIFAVFTLSVFTPKVIFQRQKKVLVLISTLFAPLLLSIQLIQPVLTKNSRQRSEKLSNIAITIVDLISKTWYDQCFSLYISNKRWHTGKPIGIITSGSLIVLLKGDHPQHLPLWSSASCIALIIIPNSPAL